MTRTDLLLSAAAGMKNDIRVFAIRNPDSPWSQLVPQLLDRQFFIRWNFGVRANHTLSPFLDTNECDADDGHLLSRWHPGLIVERRGHDRERARRCLKIPREERRARDVGRRTGDRHAHRADLNLMRIRERIRCYCERRRPSPSADGEAVRWGSDRERPWGRTGELSARSWTRLRSLHGRVRAREGRSSAERAERTTAPQTAPFRHRRRTVVSK